MKQDPNHPEVVFAGTTEGLWKTQDAGTTWHRVTAPNIIVNDVMIDPRDSTRVMLATDRSGVLISTNNSASFSASNEGFAHRQVRALLADNKNSSVLYAGMVNDKEFGGVFVTRDAGQRWSQLSNGLNGRDVFTLAQDEKGNVYAGTNAGLFRLAQNVQGVPEAGIAFEPWVRPTPTDGDRAHVEGRVEHLNDRLNRLHVLLKLFRLRLVFQELAAKIGMEP